LPPRTRTTSTTPPPLLLLDHRIALVALVYSPLRLLLGGGTD